MKKLLSIVLCLSMIAAVSGCGGKPSSPNTPDNPDQPNPPVIEPVDYTWNSAPVVLEDKIFYDDFSKGIDSKRWASDDKGWGLDKENNNGVTSKNISYSTDAAKVAAAGATGGIAVLKASGAYGTDPYKGAVLITRDDYGAGRYEARIKVLPRQGQCTALWTYFNGTPDLENTPGATLEDSKYSEIDIELPEGGDFRQMSGTTYSKYINKKNLDQTTRKMNFEKSGLGDLSLNDGKWHTLAFEWRTAENDTGIIWYVDGQSVWKATTSVPKYTATFWIGTHFPNIPSWLGVPNFDTAYMYLDWVRITPYSDPTIDECTGSKGEFTFRDLGSAEIPVTDYTINGDFSRANKGAPESALGWEADLGSSFKCETNADYTRSMVLDGGNTAFQFVDSKYKGHKMRLEVNAQRISGDGALHASIEGFMGQLLRQETSEILDFKAPFPATKSLTYELKSDKTNNLRILFTTDPGTKVKINSVRLYLE